MDLYYLEVHPYLFNPHLYLVTRDWDWLVLVPSGFVLLFCFNESLLFTKRKKQLYIISNEKGCERVAYIYIYIKLKVLPVQFRAQTISEKNGNGKSVKDKNVELTHLSIQIPNVLFYWKKKFRDTIFFLHNF